MGMYYCENCDRMHDNDITPCVEVDGELVCEESVPDLDGYDDMLQGEEDCNAGVPARFGSPGYIRGYAHAYYKGEIPR